jgi:cytochrome c
MFKSYKFRRIAVCLTCALFPFDAFAESSNRITTSNQSFHSIGRLASSAEVVEWDSNIRDDFQGLKPGRGSVVKGKALYEAQCLSCHGVSGTEVIVFSPIVGGFSKQDVKTGIVEAFEPPISVAPSTLMRVPTLATIMDYISRAMPWDNPKSLAIDEVYALTGYLLHLGGLVESDFVLSNDNVREAQSKLPNRNAFDSEHGLWPGEPSSAGGIGNGLQPDIVPVRCMSDCNPADVY